MWGGGDNNLLIPAKEQIACTQAIFYPTKIQPLIDQKLTAQGGHEVTFYEEEGQLKADVEMNAPQGFSKTYEGINVYIEQGTELSTLSSLDTKAQERRIHLQLAQGNQSAKVIIYKGAGLLGRGGNKNNKRNEQGAEKDKKQEIDALIKQYKEKEGKERIDVAARALYLALKNKVLLI